MPNIKLSDIISDECERQGLPHDAVEIHKVLDEEVEGVVIQSNVDEIAFWTERGGKLFVTKRDSD